MTDSQGPDPKLDPLAVIDAALHQLAAGASERERERLLRLGLTALSMTAGRLAEARRWARQLWVALEAATAPGDILAHNAEVPAWVREPTPPVNVTGPVIHLPADLHAEDDQGRGWTLLPLTAFHPERVYPGATLTAGRPDGHEQVIVVGTALWATARHEVKVLVTFHRPDTSAGAQR
jgi:hypothetical protein